MKDTKPILYLEINELNFIFSVGVNNEQNKFEIIYSLNVPIDGFENKKITDFEKVFNIFKENIYIIEQKINYTFKEIVLILENFQTNFVNLSGYKSLNGTQILRENIIYIINTLKNCVHETEKKKNNITYFQFKI